MSPIPHNNLVSLLHISVLKHECKRASNAAVDNAVADGTCRFPSSATVASSLR